MPPRKFQPEFPETYPARWPDYLPYPMPIRWGWRPVPNGNSVDWPQAQFAPKYLPPGSPSYQPYVYPDGSRTEVLYPQPTKIIGWLPQYESQSLSVAPRDYYGDAVEAPAEAPLWKTAAKLGIAAAIVWAGVRVFQGKPVL